MSREKMSNVDHAWLRMDGDSNLMMIVGVNIFEKSMTVLRMHELIKERLLVHRRFRQRVEAEGNGASWVTDQAFDLNYHCFETTLANSKKAGGQPGQVGDAELQAYVAELAMQPLNKDRPLWQMILVQNYKGSTALISRVHHCIGDGIALVAVMLSLTDQADGQSAAAAGAKESSKAEASAGVESNPWVPYLKPLTKGALKAIKVTEQAISRSMHTFATPNTLTEYAGIGTQVIKDIAALAMMPNDSSTSLKGKPGNKKAVAWNEPLPVEEVKLVGKVLDCSINDVLLSCVSGAIRNYLRGRGEPVDGVEIRAMVPVNLRPLKDALQLGNKFGLVPLTLPVGIENPLERLLEVKRRMGELKTGYQALLAFAILGLVGSLPKMVQDQVLAIFGKKSTAVMTNVPGPTVPIKMAGETLSRVMFWVPQSGDIAMGVSILSYAGGVQFGLITDTVLCPEPQKIIDGFAPEFEKLMLTVMMMPKEAVVTGQWHPREVAKRILRMA
jgi:diacylglycerol O-acyltransferase / wax synthase